MGRRSWGPSLLGGVLAGVARLIPGCHEQPEPAAAIATSSLTTSPAVAGRRWGSGGGGVQPGGSGGRSGAVRRQQLHGFERHAEHGSSTGGVGWCPNGGVGDRPRGAWLADHLRSGSVAAALAGGDFDVVVFQEQSMAPADRRIARESTDPSASMLTQLARAAGARVVFFQTWGHVSGSQAVGHSSYESMQNAITATYDDLGSRHLGTVAPVGEAWRAYFISGHGLPLHGPDGSHPTVAGSYLAAAVIAATITGVDPTEFSWTGSLDDVTARTLLESAERALPTAP